MTLMRTCWRMLLTLLKELADENAYQRHLAAHGVPHSAEQWRKFCDERLLGRFVRPRCC